MAVTYLVKKDSIVKLTVQVSTMGEASTLAFKKIGVLKPKLVASTPDEDGADGRIETKEIGSGEDLADATIDIDTIVELSKDIIDDTLLDPAFENIQIIYALEGGVEGKKIFNIEDIEKKTRSTSKRTISVKMPIGISLLNIVTE